MGGVANEISNPLGQISIFGIRIFIKLLHINQKPLTETFKKHSNLEFLW